MKLFAIAAALLLAASTAGATPPPLPEYIALTRANLEQLGFRFELVRRPGGTSFHLDYPADIDGVWFPQLVTTGTRTPDGAAWSQASSGASPGERHIGLFLSPKELDGKVAVRFVCRSEEPGRCQGMREYGVASILGFAKELEAK